MVECSKCRSTIRGESGIRCSGVCDKVFHLSKKCAGIDQYSAKTIDEDNYIRFICDDCMQYIQNVDLVLKDIQDGVKKNKQNLSEYKNEFEKALKQNEFEIKTLLEAIEKRYNERLRKIDKIQESCEKNVEVVRNLYGNINEFENKNKDMYNTIEKNNLNMCTELKKMIADTKVKTNMTYAQTVTKNSVLPDVSKNIPLIIKPKEKQSVVKTKAELNKKINPMNFKITNVENRKNGALVIQSENTEERDKMKEAIQNEISENYEITVPKQVELHIIVTDMHFKISEKELVEKIRKQNEILENSQMEIVKIFETKRYNKTIYNAKLKIDVKAYTKVMSIQKINVGWDRCRVFDGTNVIQCFKCYGYSHKASECKNEDICYKCHEKHKSNECNKEVIKKCINCIKENNRLNLGLDENHTTTNRECPVYQNKLSLKKKRIGIMS